MSQSHPTFWSRLADRLILCPTTNAIPTDDRTRQTIAFESGQFEVWIHEAGDQERSTVDLYVLKFPGTEGRAERSTDHPAHLWPDWRTQLWTVNPPGYGQSGGQACLKNIPSVAITALQTLRSTSGDRPVLVTGNSLGCLSAMYLAAHGQVDGILVRNPPPLRELIRGRFGWWNLGWGAGKIAAQVPQTLDAVANASLAEVPAVVTVSGRDRVVPISYQQLILDAYAGPKRVQILQQADHATPMTEDEVQEYRGHLDWLRSHLRHR